MALRALHCSVTLTTLLALAVLPSPAAAQCAGGTPAFVAHPSLWTSLRPVDAGQIPSLRDSTDWHAQTDPDFQYPLFSSLDVAAGTLFTSYSSGFMTWDVSTPARARNPSLRATRDGWGGQFLDWFSGTHIETREWVFDVDVPDAETDLLAAVGVGPVGMTIWDVGDPGSPAQLYQDRGRTIYQVWTARIEGRSWGFAVAEQGVDNGLHLYDLTAARAFPSGCVEDTTAGVECAGVWRGRIGPSQSNAYVDGVSTAAGRHLLAVTSGSPAVGPTGVELWDVSHPLAPVHLKPGGGRFLSGEGLYGIALWEHAGRVLLALATPTGGRIYDLSSCLAGTCTSLAGLQIWSRPWSVSAVRHFVTDSTGAGGRPYLYFGNENMCGAGLQREWLFDVSDPAAAVERGSGVVVPWPNPGGSPDPYPLDYWAWYYAKSPTGFSFVMPRNGKFAGDYFYRAAWTILDVHELVAPTPPEILFVDGFESGDLSGWSATAD